MAKKKTNRYRLVSNGMKIERSLNVDFCNNSTEKQIIREILICSGMFNTLESYDYGFRTIDLVPIRVHKKEEE